ncbi:unnamed protein product [Lota lota]
MGYNNFYKSQGTESPLRRSALAVIEGPWRKRNRRESGKVLRTALEEERKWGQLWRNVVTDKTAAPPLPVTPLQQRPEPQRKWTKGKPLPWGPSQPEDQLPVSTSRLAGAEAEEVEVEAEEAEGEEVEVEVEAEEVEVE